MRIAELTGVGASTILRRQRELGIEVRPQGKRGPDRKPRRAGSGRYERSPAIDRLERIGV